MATLTEIGGGGTAAAATTLVITTTATASAGDLVVVGSVNSSTQTLSSVTDSAGNTYTVRRNQGNGGGNCSGAIADSVLGSTLASGGTITLTFSASTNSGAGACVVNGQDVSPFDTSAGAGNSTVTTALTSANITTASNGELIFGVWGYTSSGAGTLTTPGTGYTALTGRASAGTVRRLAWEHKGLDGSATAGTEQATGTLSQTAQNQGGISAAYKLTTGGGPAPTVVAKLATLGVG